jgi:hypothetical protein
MKGMIIGSSLVLVISACLVLTIWNVIFPWAETTNDPDAIQVPAWFVMLFLGAVAAASGFSLIYSAWLQVLLERDKKLSIKQ